MLKSRYLPYDDVITIVLYYEMFTTRFECYKLKICTGSSVFTKERNIDLITLWFLFVHQLIIIKSDGYTKQNKTKQKRFLEDFSCSFIKRLYCKQLVYNVLEKKTINEMDKEYIVTKHFYASLLLLCLLTLSIFSHYFNSINNNKNGCLKDRKGDIH